MRERLPALALLASYSKPRATGTKSAFDGGLFEFVDYAFAVPARSIIENDTIPCKRAGDDVFLSPWLLIVAAIDAPPYRGIPPESAKNRILPRG
jgi:hypothetical protein